MDYSTYNKKPKKHIQFDLSKNETYFIDEPIQNVAHTNILPFYTIALFILFAVIAILAYMHEKYYYAYGFSFLVFGITLYCIYNYIYLDFRRQFATVPTPPDAKLPGL